MKNELIMLYDKISEVNNTYEKYISIGKDGLGNKFSFISTNSRGILTKKGDKYFGFYQAFQKIKEVEGKPRDQWIEKNKAGQEKQKQHTVKMRESQFFMVKNNAFKMTSRGSVFEKMILDDEIGEQEKRFLCYLLISSAYFSKIPNYIFVRTKEVFNAFEEQEITEEQVFESIKELIGEVFKRGFKREDIFKLDFTYLDSFTFDINSIGFLRHFNNSSQKDKEEFKDYIYKQQFKDIKKASILKKKYEGGGNYTKTSLIDNAWILYVTKKIINSSNEINNFEKFIKSAVDYYAELFVINKSVVKKFIFDTEINKSVFKVIYSQIFGVSISKYAVEKDLTVEEIKSIGVIDNTDEVGRARSEQMVSSLKKLARTNSNYKCECEDFEGCKYFTSRDTNENYLEIHHLIPREFANDFDETIEVLSNYVALCPNCHMKIHHAIDREREHLLRILLNKRKDALLKEGLQITLNELFNYYKFDIKDDKN